MRTISTKAAEREIAEGLMRDAKRYNSLRLLAVMTESDQERMLSKLGNPLIIVGEAFDNWVDELTALLAKSERKSRRVVPNED